MEDIKALESVSYSIYMIFEFINSFMFMQDEGVVFQIENTSYTFRGTITVASADNLAAWDLGGFKALSSALRKCRLSFLHECC